MNQLIITSPDEEQAVYQLKLADGTLVDIASVNHDDHGWDGMDAVGKAVEKIATALGCAIVHCDSDTVD